MAEHQVVSFKQQSQQPLTRLRVATNNMNYTDPCIIILSRRFLPHNPTLLFSRIDRLFPHHSMTYRENPSAYS